MILVLDCGSKKTSTFETVFGELGMDTRTVSLDELKTCRLSDYMGMVISGSPYLLVDRDLNELLPRFMFLRAPSLPVLGVCFGHQVIGLFYGANYWKGLPVNRPEVIETLGHDVLFEGIRPFSQFDEDHMEHISLPAGFKLLARSGTSRNEAMVHKELPIYGVQFHPETSGLNGQLLLRNFLLVCSRYKSTKARKK